MDVIWVELHRKYICKEQRKTKVQIGTGGLEPVQRGRAGYALGMCKYDPWFLRRGLASNSIGHLGFSRQGKHWQQH